VSRRHQRENRQRSRQANRQIYHLQFRHRILPLSLVLYLLVNLLVSRRHRQESLLEYLQVNQPVNHLECLLANHLVNQLENLLVNPLVIPLFSLLLSLVANPARVRLGSLLHNQRTVPRHRIPLDNHHVFLLVPRHQSLLLRLESQLASHQLPPVVNRQGFPLDNQLVIPP
jgi:hypothetical protein